MERADASDADALAQVIADAFHSLAVSQWLIPDPGARRAIFPGYFGIHAERALADGLVLTTPARDSAALWIPAGADRADEPPEEYHGRLAAITGVHLERFKALDEEFGRRHPAGVAHEYLAILAVRPDRQRLGIGTALMHARHVTLDCGGVPAYLEASDLEKRGMYLRHGYADYGSPIELPGGPCLYPMMRQPRPVHSPGICHPS